MLINQVMEKTGLTRKAIYYYESEGLISPEKDPENNYRKFTRGDLETLKKINLLRKYGFSVVMIKKIFAGEIELKKAVKTKLKTIEEELESLKAEKIILSNIIKQGQEDIFKKLVAEESRFESAVKERENYLLKEFLRLFPGRLGYIFAAINTPYLIDSKLDTREKKAAWERLIKILDSYDELELNDELAKVLNRIYKKYDEEYISMLKNNSEELTNSIISGEKDPAKLLKKASKSSGDIDITDEEEAMVTEYIAKEIQPIMAEVGEELKILSPKFKAFSERIESIEIDDELEELIPEA